jgi:phosphatidylserine decarboxylase
VTLTSLRDRLLVDTFRWAPTGLYSALVGWGARARLPRPLRAPLYGAFARAVDARTEEAGAPLSEYASFGDFFARHLRPGARPIDDDVLVAPADGVIAAAGRIAGDTLVQAKGRDYTVGDLVVDDRLAAALTDGQFATIYLSPRDYHRVHVPCAATLRGYHYVPGMRWPVSLPFVRGVDRLFAVNERVVIELATAWGPAALVMVAAVGVGNIWLTHLGEGGGDTRAWRAQAERHSVVVSASLAAGDEVGAFLLGSTVIVLLPPGAPALDLADGQVVQVGQSLGLGGQA